MKDFAALYRKLDAATSIRSKHRALVAYLTEARTTSARRASAAWAIYLLAGGKPRQIAPTRYLRRLAQETAEVPEWLFEESYATVGDLAETVCLLTPVNGTAEAAPLHIWMTERLLPLRDMPDAEKYAAFKSQALATPPSERFVFFKILTGHYRIGVSKQQIIRALAEVAALDAVTIAHRMSGYTQADRRPDGADFDALLAPADECGATLRERPYPFYLAHPLGRGQASLPAALGPIGDWLAEWKFDGVRGQAIVRNGRLSVWSRGEELVTESFPELAALETILPQDICLDGEIVVMRSQDSALIEPESLSGLESFATLQRRLGRRRPGSKILADAPAAFIAYDLLDCDGVDLRSEPQHQRRARLSEVVHRAFERTNLQRFVAPPLRLSPLLRASDWDALDRLRQDARRLGAEGVMLKASEGRYGAGRRKGGDRTDVWWKWKLDPLSLDAVLIYAQRGHGRRSGLCSDYTFAVWTEDEDGARRLTPFARAYSGLDDAEMKAVDRIIRRTTVETFGPVRRVEPTLVFELGFEGVVASGRHKSGVAVRFPRILRWRKDKSVAEADTLAHLKSLVSGATNG